MDNPYARLVAPTECDCCKSRLVGFSTNRAVYGEHALEPDVRIIHCRACGASVALHPYTDIPMGRMADKRLRALRREAHLEFDALWKYTKLTRTQAYKILREELELPAELCHMAMMDKTQLRHVIAFTREYLSAETELRRRREDKKHERRTKRAERAAATEAQKRREKRAAFAQRKRGQRYG